MTHLTQYQFLEYIRIITQMVIHEILGAVRDVGPWNQCSTYPGTKFSAQKIFITPEGKANAGRLEKQQQLLQERKQENKEKILLLE